VTTTDVEPFPERLTRRQREAIASALPWVAADPGANEQCEAIKGSAPLKAYWDRSTGHRVPDDHPDRIKHRCKFAARWVFVSLYGEVRRFCWSHLIYRGIYGGMEEEARTRAWDEKHADVIEAIKKAEIADDVKAETEETP